MFRILMIFVSWINGQEEYCLSSEVLVGFRGFREGSGGFWGGFRVVLGWF